MRRLAAPMSLLLLTLVGGCRSHAKPSTAGSAAGSEGPSRAALVLDARVPPAWRTDPVFSAPIAAARSGQVSVVAGLVATQHVVRVVGLRDGSASFSTD